MRSEVKPSRIPTPESTSRPLPSLGYVADDISLLRVQCPPNGEGSVITSLALHAQRPPNGETPLVNSMQHPRITVPPAKPPKTVTVEFRAITTNEQQPSKASCEERSNPSTQSAAVKPKHSMNDNGRTETRKKRVTKPAATTRDKHSTIIKQMRPSASHKMHSSWGGSGRLNELRIR